MKTWWTVLLVCGLALGCDDDSADSDGAGQDAGAGGAGQGGQGSPFDGVYNFTTIAVTQPASLGIVGVLLSNSIRDELVYLFIELSGWGTDAMLIRGGAGEQTEGTDTEDFDDDAFCWLTEGQCRNAEGDLSPCSVEVGETEGTSTDNTFSGASGGDLNLYADSLNTLIKFKDVALDGSIVDGALDGTLRGKMLASDAEQTYIQPTPNGPIIQFKGFLDMLMVETDTDVDGAPAYQFTATFGAVESRFACP